MTNEQKEAVKRTDALIDQMLAEHGLSARAVLGKEGLVSQLAKRVVERALAGELTHHLGYEKGGPPLADNCRNGSSRKTIIGEDGAMEIAVPGDRAGTFEPVLIAKGQKRFEGFDEKIIGMYARGISTGDSADVHCASDTFQPGVLCCSRSAPGGGATERDLPGGERSGRPAAPGRVRAKRTGEEV